MEAIVYAGIIGLIFAVTVLAITGLRNRELDAFEDWLRDEFGHTKTSRR